MLRVDHFSAENADALIAELGLVLQVREAGDIQRVAPDTCPSSMKPKVYAARRPRLVQGFTQCQPVSPPGGDRRYTGRLLTSISMQPPWVDLTQQVEEADAGLTLSSPSRSTARRWDIICVFVTRLTAHDASRRVSWHLFPAQHAALAAQPLNAHVSPAYVGRPIADHVAVGGIEHAGLR